MRLVASSSGSTLVGGAFRHKMIWQICASFVADAKRTLFDRAGRAEEMCANPNGRELWVPGKLYDIESTREWLLDEGKDWSNFGTAHELGLVPEGVEREGITESCLAVEQNGGLGVVDEVGLRGVGRQAARGLALARARQQPWQGHSMDCVRGTPCVFSRFG